MVEAKDCQPQEVEGKVQLHSALTDGTGSVLGIKMLNHCTLPSTVQ